MKKPKAEDAQAKKGVTSLNSGESTSSRVKPTLSDSFPSAGKFDNSKVKLYEKIKRKWYTEGKKHGWATNEGVKWIVIETIKDSLKEGYSLGKQDMIREIGKKAYTGWGTINLDDIVIHKKEWQALKKKEGIE
jgi:hypothetical protein